MDGLSLIYFLLNEKPGQEDMWSEKLCYFQIVFGREKIGEQKTKTKKEKNNFWLTSVKNS